MNKICIITARGGSKRIPRKNIKDFLGKPIIAYSIEAALTSRLFSEVMVSTDDEEIAEVSKAYGASVPFLRSQKNSDDFSTTSDVLVEVIEAYRSIGAEFDTACCIYPTAPFVTPEKLQEAFAVLQEHKYDSLFPIVKFGFPILRSLTMENSLVQPNWPENYLKRSQDLPPAYHDAGQFYCFNVPVFLKNKNMMMERTGAIIVDENSVQDIDTEDDWRLAELKYRLLHEHNHQS